MKKIDLIYHIYFYIESGINLNNNSIIILLIIIINRSFSVTPMGSFVVLDLYFINISLILIFILFINNFTIT